MGVGVYVPCGIWLIGLWRYNVTEYGTALTTILPILFLYLNTVIVTAGTLELQ
jgi:hypothetical protein